MTEFENWCEKINEQYTQKRVNLCIGLKHWLEDFKVGKGFSDDTKSRLADFFNQHSISNDKIFIAVVIAKSFYPEEYAYYKEHGNFSSQGLFKASGTYMKTLRDVFKDDKIAINFLNASNTYRKGDWYCLEIASALQQQFRLFEAITDVNKFIRSVGKLESGHWFWDYGFYIRSVSELCCAYAVLHGYSGKQTFDLVLRSSDALLSAQKAKNAKVNLLKTATQDLADSFSEYLAMTNTDEKGFISQIVNNCDKLVVKGATTHWSTVKKALWSASGFNKKNLSSNKHKEMTDIQELGRELAGRIQWTMENLYEGAPLNEDDLEQLYDSTLARYLAERLGTFNNSQYDNKWAMYMLNGPIRCLYILSIMKELSQGNIANSSIWAVNYINMKLQAAALRTIELTDSTSIAEYRDTFDWFVAQCLKYEEDNALYDDERVAGFDTFMNFVSTSLEEELGR